METAVQVLLKLFELLVWFLEHFLIADRSGDDDYHNTSGASAPGANCGDTSAADSRLITEALRFFDIESKDDLTREVAKKAYKRLSLVHHPDRNNNSPDSNDTMKKVNEYYSVLLGEVDAREGHNVEQDDEDGTGDDDDHETEDERRYREEQERQRQAYEEESMQRKQEELEEQMREYKKKERERKKERRKASQKYRRANLHMPTVRQGSYQGWATEVQNRQNLSYSDNENNKPRCLVMEYSVHEISMALRRGETDIAVELVHEKIGSAIQRWVMENIWNSHHHHAGGGWVGVKMDDTTGEQVLREALLTPLDEDCNTVLHYAIYCEDEEMISYLAEQARRFGRLDQLITFANVFGLTPDFFARRAHNEIIKQHLERLHKEVAETRKALLESRKLLPTMKRQINKLSKAPTFVPLAFSGYGYLFGRVVFDAGLAASFVIMACAVKFSEDEQAASLRQILTTTPSSLAGALTTFHVLWLLLKMYLGAMPWAYYISLPIVVFVFVALPPGLLLDPLLLCTYYFKTFIAHLVHFASDRLPTKIPALLKTAIWLSLHMCCLLIFKAIVWWMIGTITRSEGTTVLSSEGMEL